MPSTPTNPNPDPNQEENRRLHALLAEAREGEGGATSRKRGPWFQQMLSSRREETLTLTRTRTRNLTLTLTLTLTLP